MLVLGTANPSGESTGYNGLYFRQEELDHMVKQKELNGISVKAEHTGNDIGKIVSTFLDRTGALQCVLEIDDSVEGSIASGLVRDGIAADLSMGYAVDVKHSGQKLVAGRKKTLEVSLVRKGAREGCHIQAYQTSGSAVKYTKSSEQAFVHDTWAEFDLS